VWLIPLSLLWGGIALYWEAGALGFIVKSGFAGFDLFALWGIPFAVAGQYFIWGRFVFKRWDRLRTIYAVTNQRLLTTKGGNLQSVFLSQLPAINQSTRADGSGTLDFGAAQNGPGFWFSRRHGVTTFDDIQDVRNVYRLIAEARSGPA